MYLGGGRQRRGGGGGAGAGRGWRGGRQAEAAARHLYERRIRHSRFQSEPAFMSIIASICSERAAARRSLIDAPPCTSSVSTCRWEVGTTILGAA